MGGYLDGFHKGASWKSGKDLLLTYGNKKMTIPLFSIPAKKTCPGSTELCRKYCYAKKTEEIFPFVRSKRARALTATKKDDFVALVCKELSTVPLIPYFRIHESGDFYSQDYLNKWFEICNKFPEKTFLAFTKVFNLDYSKKPKNLNLYFSIFPDTDLTKVPDIKGIKKAFTVINYKAVVARGLKVDSGKAKKCEGYCDSCLLCFKAKSDVYFPVH
jgi:hypothetical protein